MEENIIQEEKELIEDKSAKISEDEIIRIRKDKIVKFFKTNYNWVAYILLAVIVYLALKIRTRNLPGLRDITTGTWTLGPDLDPFLFLRWAKYIFEHGSIMAIDTMRFVPVGYDTRGEMMLLSYMIVWFHKIAVFFGSTSITQSAVLFPVFMFGLTVIAFFLMTRKIFFKSLGEKSANIIALISSFFLSVMPPLLPRTIAGIPEKESAAFLFIFLSFYLFLCAWESKHKRGKYIFALLAGLSTGITALIWGGYQYIFVTIGLSLFIAFILEKIDKESIKIVLILMFSSFILMNMFSTRYTLMNLISSTIILLTIFPLLLYLVNILIIKKLKNKSYYKNRFSKIPEPIAALILTLFLIVLISTIVFGPSYVLDKFNDLKRPLIVPTSSRFGVTVAENRQPYFNEWESSFGPHIKEIAISFWLFVLGSVLLFFFSTAQFKIKERVIITAYFNLFLLSFGMYFF